MIEVIGMPINVEFVMARLTQNGGTIRSLVAGVAPEQAQWKPAPTQWSILEVVNHLVDEEVEDFRTRLELVLHHPTQAWPGIAPEAWVVERAYNSRALADSLQRFAAARQASVAWLQGLVAPAWETETRRPGRAPMQAGTLLAAWLAHDWLHIRQITRLHYEYLAQMAQPYHLEYAGRW